VPLWIWIAAGAAVLLLAFLVLAIWAYPRDGSF